MVRLSLILIALQLWGGSGVNAGGGRQSTLPQPIRIAGLTVECRDIRGREVQNLQVTDLGDVGRAWVINTVPYIVMDRKLLKRLPDKLQLFFYGHECAHHQLGHWFNLTQSSEQDADCHAIKDGRKRGLFTRADVESFAPYFSQSRGSTVGHLPGPKRVEFLLQCFDNKR